MKAIASGDVRLRNVLPVDAKSRVVSFQFRCVSEDPITRLTAPTYRAVYVLVEQLPGHL